MHIKNVPPNAKRWVLRSTDVLYPLSPVSFLWPDLSNLFLSDQVDRFMWTG